jgi:hypothetical protein
MALNSPNWGCELKATHETESAQNDRVVKVADVIQCFVVEWEGM